ncbi:MAG: PASTA domain-containing protein [Prevotellaceae bacterium]|jgi:cell division protein FtsI (penicillin-binding protein 3)|nr:PASTA domain-containing protein [Prevotellaceae bacterium]
MKKKKDRVLHGAEGLYVSFLVFFIIFVGILIHYQYFDKSLRENKTAKKKSENIENDRSPRRGDILSSDGQTLASYLPEYMLSVDFKTMRTEGKTINKAKVVENKKSPHYLPYDTLLVSIYEQFSKALSRFVGEKSAGEYYRMLYNYKIKGESMGNDKKSYTVNFLRKNISILQKDSIFNIPYLKKYGQYTTGIFTEEVGKRLSPFKNMAHSALGVVGDNGNTLSGIEMLYNDELLQMNNVISTIDTRMQDICDNILRKKLKHGNGMFTGGSIMLMEVATGNIKAIANLGSYEDDRYAPENMQDNYNNALMTSMEPGSTFKVVSLITALETGKIKITDKINCDEGCVYVKKNNRTEKYWNQVKEVDNKEFGELSVSEIISKSVNIGTAKMVHIAFNGKSEKFIKAIKNLGVLDTLGLSEAVPYINSDPKTVSMYHISHGYQVRMSPVHTLSLFNAIANNGTMVKPRLVCGIQYITGEKKMFEPEIIKKSICSSNTLNSVKEVLAKVVESGSARFYGQTWYGISGKTGTAQMYVNKRYTDRDLASFCGYFPKNKPQYSCIVVLYSKHLSDEERKNVFGSRDAVPVFREVADKIHALNPHNLRELDTSKTAQPLIKNTSGKNLSTIATELNLPVDAGNNEWVKIDTVNNKFKVSKISVKQEIIPNVVGMGLRDAMFLLENRGLRVIHKGTGTVVKQTPEHDTPFEFGKATVVLELN